MDKMKRGGFFRGMLDNWRYSSSSLGSQSGSTHHSSRDDSKSTSKSDSPLADYEDNLKSEHFLLSEIVRHGFPHNPTCVAFDPIQRLIAIGTRNGCLRIIGRPGVDINVQHIGQFAVIQIIFLVNEGNLITLCADDSIHLWSIKTKTPSIVNILKFQKERITYAHLPYSSKWLYVGTERGNVHIVNIDSFQLSGYVINWNKAIELSRKTHPGSVIHLSDCPIDPSKLLIGYESGTIVLWDLRSKSADSRVNYTEPLRSISWHNEGRQYLCSHTDGSITTWNVRAPRPVSVTLPHAKQVTKELKPEPCRPIYKVEWKTVRDADSFIIFSGGLPFSSLADVKSSTNVPTASASTPPVTTTSSTANSRENILISASSGSTSSDSGSESRIKVESNKSSDSMTSGTQSLTVIHGKTTTVLEMEHNIVDFITLSTGTCPAEPSDPYAILVLLSNDLVVVDLTSPGYPCFRNPYTMDLHESPITFCAYFADCPTDLIPAFYSVGFKTNPKRPGISEKEWPINGGEWGTATPSYPEIIITGHADGTVKFWDTSSVNLHILYKMKTSKLFQKPRNRPNENSSANESTESPDDPFAIDQIKFCPESRLLCVAGASSHIMIFKFNKQEAHSDTPVIEVIMNYESSNAHDESGDPETTQGIGGLLRPQGSGDDGNSTRNTFYPLLVRSGQHKRVPGFQPELVCLTPWIDDNTPPFKITSLAVNSSYSLIAYGSENGLIIVDLIQKSLVLNIATADLYATELRETNWLRKSEKLRLKNLVNPLVAASQTIMSVAKSYRDKIDNSFSRSRSSSISSLDNISNEPIQCLTFAESYATKSETSYGPCLWVGTNQGSALSVTITLPETNDNRVLCLQSVLAVSSGNVFRLKGSILCISFLDYSGTIVGLTDSKTATPTGLSKGGGGPGSGVGGGGSSGLPGSGSTTVTGIINAAGIDEKRSGSLTISRSSSSGAGNFNISRCKVSPTSSSTDMKDSQFVVIVSEKQARTISLPSQMCIAKAELSETSFTIRADVIQMKFSENGNCMCLVTYLATGNIVVYSLPSLKQLIDIDFPSVNVRIARTISFSTNGHGMYLTSPSEIQKFTIASSLRDIIPDMVGNLYVVKEMPEPPKQSFFKGLFSGGPSILDREELFGEAQSGKGSKVVAKLIPGSQSGLDHAKLQSGSLAAELAKARMGLTERGEALEKLEDKTARMMDESEGFRNLSRQLLNKYENKKWYQF
ncbi:syntaxin-binding protein 5-like [Panonychus citri]|uniref:syntaxin-binding protein 5-like n=1 Tax=Panonychus citri TaxID=50023 RepID=UPI002307DCCB|nr:syntaxin-binding protein 5-like [Panonychus citri]